MPKTTKPTRKRGRPTRYTRAVAEVICRRLASGESLRAICRDESLPSEGAVRGWAVDGPKGFSAQYPRARDIGLDAMADELLEIADDGDSEVLRVRRKP